jgi:hypothetical protein
MSNIPDVPADFPEDPNAILGRTFRLFLGAVWPDGYRCPICGSDNWEIRVAVDLKARYLEDKVVTAMPVQCRVCHYLVLFNAVTAGLFTPDGYPDANYTPPERIHLPVGELDYGAEEGEWREP